MGKRLDALFYTFLLIFAGTAVVTLLGVIKVVTIEGGQLNALLGAFLLELAGAVVVLFRGAPFFEVRSDVAGTVSNSVEVIDALVPEIEAVISGNAQAEVNRQYGVIVRRQGKDLVAYQRLQVIPGEQLEHLSGEEKEAIKVHADRMTSLRDRWEKLYERRIAAKDEKQRAKIDGELKLLGKDLKIEFQATLEFLIRQGAVLEDHYRHVRSIVDRLANA
jgi:hypothetical protein